MPSFVHPALGMSELSNVAGSGPVHPADPLDVRCVTMSDDCGARVTGYRGPLHVNKHVAMWTLI
jgi:hypothetical protein